MDSIQPDDLLLGAAAADDMVRRLLEPAGFADWRAAYRRLQAMGRSAQVRRSLSASLPHLLARLETAADPDNILISLERLAGSAHDPARLFDYLARNPRAIEILATIFDNSQYTTEILVRNPEWVEQLDTQVRQAETKSSAQFTAEAFEAVAALPDGEEPLDGLRRYQRRELLRIAACDLLDSFDLPAVTGQLSNLADGLVSACLSLAAQPSGSLDSEFAVLAMGKLGGCELNYSSDIDLLFISQSDDPYYRRLGERMVAMLAGMSGEGFLYRVDMRLRPWGRTGQLVPTVQGYLTYLRKDARLWEKQALLKARMIAGDIRLGESFLRQATGLLYEFDETQLRGEVFAMKQRTESYLREQGRNWGEVKLGEGSIRDVEFVTQFLQLAYGGKQPEVRSRNTLEGLQRLVRYGLLPVEDGRILSDGYVFLRTVEHFLQMMHYRQTNTLPRDATALARLSRRLGFQGPGAGELFTSRYLQHSAAIRSIFLKYLGGQPMDEHDPPAARTPEVQRHIARMDASYETTFSPQDIARHAALAAGLDPSHLVEVDAAPLQDGRWRVTIIAYDYPGELSLICGLMFVYGLEIEDGNVFTYEPSPSRPESRQDSPAPRKIVDVFTIHPSSGEVEAGLWRSYSSDLSVLLQLARANQRQEARVRLARRAAEALEKARNPIAPLYPIEIEIDNELSPLYTVLRITATDTAGFLYELTNALAFNRVYIARVRIDTVGSRVQDILFVTDNDGRKITSDTRLRELKAATVLIKHFTHLLPLSPDPETALLHFHAFIGELFRRPDWPDELASLERPEVLGALAQLLGVSDFLWDDFLRMQHAALFPVVRDVDALATSKSRKQLEDELEDALILVKTAPENKEASSTWQEALNAFKDREMFRIDMRHILGHTHEFWEFAAELTTLTEIVVSAAFHQILAELESSYGAARLDDGSPAPMNVFGLGKCGGRELGFASDIELMFVYAGNGKTDGPDGITTGEFYEKLVERFVSAVHSRREGIFEIDLRLRPYGKAGSLAVSLESFRRYFSPEGPAWPYERQALVRMRPLSGDEALGQRVMALRDSFLYTGAPFDVTAMRAMRERQIRHLVKGGTFNPKYSPGGMVDVEYLVQALQINHGAGNPALRVPNTREAIAALAEAGILSPDETARLRKAYTFLRWLIDSLRMVAGNARDLTVPPEDSEEFAYLARRLRYGGDREKLKQELRDYSSFVQDINKRLLG